jgi:hypothetical protein
MRRLLTTTGWDADLVRDDLRGYATAALGDPGGVLIGDDARLRRRTLRQGAAAVHGHCWGDHELPAGVFLA